MTNGHRIARWKPEEISESVTSDEDHDREYQDRELVGK